MAEISSTDAALIGFQLTRRHPLAVLTWGILSAIASLVSIAAMTLLAGPAIMAMQAMTPGNTDSAAALAGLAAMSRAYIVVLPLSLVLGGVLYAGAGRLVLRPQDQGLGWLKLGAAEVRQMGVLVLVALILLGAYIGMVVLVGLIGGIAAVINPALGVLLAVLVGLAGLAALFYIGTRLSMLSPIAFATGKISVSASWRMTEGRVLPMLGAYVLAAVMAAIVAILALCIFFGVAGLLVGWGKATAVLSPDMTSLATVFTPLAVVYYLFTGLVNALNALIFLTPAPDIYRQLNSSADVFD